MFDSYITLIAEEYTASSIGELVSTEVERPTWAERKSVQRSEWLAAGQQGLQPALVLKVPEPNYNGEKIAVVDGLRYSIYRTYSKGHGDIELYLEKQGGI